MKTLKLSLVIMAAALLTIGLSGMAYAFHSGGVADCGGCHSMHSPVSTSYLLGHTDPSSTCLGCHANSTAGSYHVMTYPDPGAGAYLPGNYNVGGDFGWLLKTYTYASHGTATVTENGQTHGHNIIAADYALGTADSDFSVAPGGTFSSNQLGCNSCHDPHGKYRRDSTGAVSKTGAPIISSGSQGAIPASGQAVGVYRLLAGVGYSQNAGTLAISYPGVPIAVAPSGYGSSEQTTQYRVAYGVTSTGNGVTAWGFWCAACHTNVTNSGHTNHPIDQPLGATIANQYGQYVSSGIMTGSASSSYLSLVPFMDNNSDIATLKSHASSSNGYLNGPGSSDQVSCLSCHRAHASGFQNMLRWGMNYEFITVADGSGNAIYPGNDNGAAGSAHQGRKAAEWQAAYYNRLPTMFGAYQRVLCNKCHAQD